MVFIRCEEIEEKIVNLKGNIALLDKSDTNLPERKKKPFVLESGKWNDVR